MSRRRSGRRSYSRGAPLTQLLLSWACCHEADSQPDGAVSTLTHMHSVLTLNFRQLVLPIAFNKLQGRTRTGVASKFPSPSASYDWT